MSICGLDFGTSNTTLGTIEGNAPVLVALEADQTTIPSAIFYKADGTAVYTIQGQPENGVANARGALTIYTYDVFGQSYGVRKIANLLSLASTPTTLPRTGNSTIAATSAPNNALLRKALPNTSSRPKITARKTNIDAPRTRPSFI